MPRSPCWAASGLPVTADLENGFAEEAAGVGEAAEELRDAGTYGFWERAKVGAQAARAAFG
jgi:hypothetical protein